MVRPVYPSDDVDDEDSVGSNEVEYGIHTAKLHTLLLYHDASSLYPFQCTEVEYYLIAARNLLVMIIPFVQLLVDYDLLLYQVSKLLAFRQRISSPSLAVLQY